MTLRTNNIDTITEWGTLIVVAFLGHFLSLNYPGLAYKAVTVENSLQ